MDRTEPKRNRMTAHRQHRREAGLRETVVWLPMSVQEMIDQAIEAGRFKNRSEAIEAATHSFFATAG